MSTKDLRQPHGCKKLTPKYTGPFKVIKQINEVTYRLELPRDSRIVPSFHVSRLKPIITGPLATDVPFETPPVPLEISGQPAYLIKSILNSRHRRGKLEFLIEWEGYRPEEQYWVPAQDILDLQLCKDFHASHPELPGPRPRGRPRKDSAYVVSLLGGVVLSYLSPATTWFPGKHHYKHGVYEVTFD